MIDQVLILMMVFLAFRARIRSCLTTDWECVGSVSELHCDPYFSSSSFYSSLSLLLLTPCQISAPLRCLVFQQSKLIWFACQAVNHMLAKEIN